MTKITNIVTDYFRYYDFVISVKSRTLGQLMELFRPGQSNDINTHCSVLLCTLIPYK